MWGRGGRSLRLECLCLDSVIAGGPTTLALCRVFRLLIKGYTRHHWTHAERDWARGHVDETKTWWNAGQMDVEAMMGAMPKVAKKEFKVKAHTLTNTQNDHSTETKALVPFFFFFTQSNTTIWAQILPFCKKMHVDKQRCDVLCASWAALSKQRKKWESKSSLHFLLDCKNPLLSG